MFNKNRILAQFSTFTVSLLVLSLTHIFRICPYRRIPLYVKISKCVGMFDWINILQQTFIPQVGCSTRGYLDPFYGNFCFVRMVSQNPPMRNRKIVRPVRLENIFQKSDSDRDRFRL